MLSPIPNSRVPSTEDTDFLENLVVQQQAPLLRYATRLLRDSERARDVVQDTFVKLMAEPRTSIDGHAVEWLFTVCRHRALDVLRKERRLTSLDPEHDERVISGEPRPGRSLEHAETQEAVRRLIEALPANQQEVVRLKFQHGFSYKEVSRITGLSVSHVGFLIHTAVARMRAQFASRQPGGEPNR